jgi:hypothetical protein
MTAAGPEKKSGFLPPVLKPVFFALSSGVIALVIWDKTVTAPQIAQKPTADMAKVLLHNQAPVSQLDATAQVSGVAATTTTALPRPSMPARAPGAPIDSGTTSPLIAERGAPAMTEEQRSARNEQIFGYLEREKTKLGIAHLIEKNPSIKKPLLKERSAPKINAPAPVLLTSRPTTGLVTATTESRGNPPSTTPERLAPDAGLVFSNASSLQSSWILLGFSGAPPAIDFSTSRVVLIKPSTTKIISTTVGTDAVKVVYRSLAPEDNTQDTQQRVAVIPLEPKTVVVIDGSPR